MSDCGGPDARPGGRVEETADPQGAYPRLDEAQIAVLAAYGQRRQTRRDGVLFREGDRNCDFFVILAGHVAAVEGRGTPEERLIGVHGRGRFLGELNLLTGEAAFYSAVAVNDGEVLAVPADRLRELVVRDLALGDIVLRACLVRRTILIGLGVGLRIVGSRYSPDLRRLRDFAARNRLPYRWLDLSAAVYGASEGLRTIAIDDTATGGQASTSSRIENYLGFPSGISGAELAGRAMIQAQKFGARFAVPASASSLEPDGTHYRVKLEDGTSITARSVVLATGARYRRLNVPRADHFEKMSIYYAASQAEAVMCRGDPVAIVGGGNSAGQAAVFLSQHAARVTMIVRERDLSEYMSRYLIDQVTRIPNVRVLLGTEVCELAGDQALEAVTVADNQTGERRILQARALFVFIGVTPCTGWLSGLLDLDEHGFVVTGPAAARPGGDGMVAAGSGWQCSALETSQPGVFAVGDVRSGSTKRVAAAVGEGAMAISLAFERMRLAWPVSGRR